MDRSPDVLTDPRALAAADHVGITAAVATAGAQVRAVAEQLASARFDRPRAMIVVDAAGTGDPDLLAALLPSTRVPVTWQAGLPDWAGALDLVVVLASSVDDGIAARAAADATHRGAQLVVRSADRGMVAAAAGPAVVAPRLSVPELVAGPGRLAFLLGIAAAADIAPGGPPQWDALADALDAEALTCGPAAAPFVNPALALALHLAGGAGLLVAGEPLGVALARRGARSLRLLGGHPTAAQHVAGLLPGGQLTARMTRTEDLFADPEDEAPAGLRPAGVLIGPLGDRDDRAAASMAALSRSMPRAMVLAPDAPAGPGPAGWAAAAATLALRIDFAAAYLGIAAGQVPPSDGPEGLGPAGGARIVRPATTVEDVTSDDRDTRGDRRWS